MVPPGTLTGRAPGQPSACRAIQQLGLQREGGPPSGCSQPLRAEVCPAEPQAEVRAAAPPFGCQQAQCAVSARVSTCNARSLLVPCGVFFPVYHEMPAGPTPRVRGRAGGWGASAIRRTAPREQLIKPFTCCAGVPPSARQPRKA